MHPELKSVLVAFLPFLLALNMTLWNKTKSFGSLYFRYF